MPTISPAMDDPALSADYVEVGRMAQILTER